MKKFFAILMLMAVFCSMTAQTTGEQYKQQIKERKEMLKYSDKVIQTKRTKESKRAEKLAKKEGWKPFPGEKPLVSQIDERMRIEVLTENGTLQPKYIVGTGVGKSSNLQMAFDQAKAHVAIDLARNFGVEIDEVIDKSTNETIMDDEVHAIIKYISESTQYLSKNIKNIHTVVKMYRELDKGLYEVSVYSYTDYSQVKNALFDKMESDSADLRKKLDKLIENK